ncbi:hypothetical protein ALP22_00042 [Pseudomonas coronafaciens pv. porri]|nr:hypothetical protein ALQ25_04877 [Pseudomonas coronafaciens pv. atropurpurea]RMR94665.1 hypothetical protein ALP74_04576 [Pseudomonas coronafaciens pv. garcae]RMU88252.1 hypothetical protein ALP20_02551 [Pseudomonas coronafaciens pv. coronafaciens]RMU88988.1 hypothetical protein ALP22_00042 [Pseudomonas coronafaciens pv. porri]RMV87752.1 hypothetical protein ALP02_00523 [Pseudomonas coronafaciens pv. garcae]
MVCFNQPAIDQDLHLERRTFAPVVLPALLSTYRSARAPYDKARFNCLSCSSQVLRPARLFYQMSARVYWNLYLCTVLFRVVSGNTLNMNTQTQHAIHTLTNAFAPMNCLIMAARKGCFSFTIVNEHGIARHSERLYPDQYASAEPLQAVIERTRQALIA